MTLPEPLARFWAAMSRAGQFCQQTPWGFVVADPRYPRVWDANHAAVLSAPPEVTAGEIRRTLDPILRWAGATHEHIELWEFPQQSEVLSDLEAIAGTLPVDIDMVFQGDPRALPEEPPAGLRIEVVTAPDAQFLAWYRSSRDEFGEPLPEEVLDQMLARDLEVFLPLGLRWIAAFRQDDPVGYTSLLSLEGVGYLDGVMTSSAFRGRGVATATVAAALRASAAAGDEAVHLLADEGGGPRRLYERMGFRVRARARSFTRPLEDATTL